jgi:hypothetical protein
MPDWKAQSKVAAEALAQFKASVEASVQTHVQGFYFQLDEANRSMHSKLRATYLVFVTNPCGFDADWLDARMREVMAEESGFRGVMLEVHRLNALAATGVGAQTLISEISNSLRELKRPAELQRVAEAFKEGPKAVDEWQEGLG